MGIYWVKNRDGSKTAYVSISIKGAKRVRESTGINSKAQNAKQLAREYYIHRERQIWRERCFNERPERYWEDAVNMWLKERSHKRSIKKDETTFRWLYTYLKGKTLPSITRDSVESIMQIKEGEGAKPATINRHAALIRSVLRAARDEWDWIDKAPAIRMRKENNSIIRYLERSEAETLIRELNKNAPHLADAVIFSLNTGLRDSNVCSLRWSQINTEQRAMYISAAEMKAANALGIPLNNAAMEVIAKNKGKHETHVFTHNGQPFARCNNSAWRKALKRAGIENFRWHDLRHTWATWMVIAGCPLEQLQKLGGWKSPAMVMRYAHFSTSHLSQFSDLLDKNGVKS